MTARLFRDGMPVGPIVERAADLPVEHPPANVTTWQVVPRRCGAVASDVWVVDEVAYLLIGRCGVNHWAWRRLVEHMTDIHGDEATDWLDLHEVWSARRADPATLRR